ncbi:hypothetical protein TDB9533_04601 [Thalassocella blandensis]|nr:hypothetical protein TDB9533_04601 [Thalassocella blandensis]
MAVNSAKSSLNFSGGINAVSFLNKEKSQPNLPEAKRIIFFNEDAAPSHLSKLFNSFTGKTLLDRTCKPSKQEFLALQANFSGRQAMTVLQWFKSLERDTSLAKNQKIEDILTMFAEVELKEQVQRNLLKQV